MPSWRHDFNPDKERHVDHRYIVTKSTRDSKVTGLKLGDREVKFNNQGFAMVEGDPVIANELRSVAGRDATVSRVRYPKPADRGHIYFFGSMPAMPWHKYDKYGQRIKENEHVNVRTRDS